MKRTLISEDLDNILMSLSDGESKMIQEVAQITGSNYLEEDKKTISVWGLFLQLEDALAEIESLKEKYNALEEDVRENYQRIPYSPDARR